MLKVERGKSFMKRILTLGLALAVITSALFSLSACSSSGDEAVEEQTTVPAEYTESAVPVGKTSEEILTYFNSLLNGVKENKPAIHYNIEKNVPNGSILVTKAGQEQAETVDESLVSLNDAAKAIKDLMLEEIKGESGDVQFGADNKDIMFVKGEAWATGLTVDDISVATMTEVGDNYFITIEFNDIAEEDAQEVLSKAFNLRDKQAILESEEFAKTKEYIELKGYSVVYSGCKITATVNRLTNEITNVNYFKAANVTASALGKNNFSHYGDLSILFTLEDKANFEINWQSENPTSPLETTEMVTGVLDTTVPVPVTEAN